MLVGALIRLRTSVTIPAFKSPALLISLPGVVGQVTNVMLTTTTSTSQSAAVHVSPVHAVPHCQTARRTHQRLSTCCHTVSSRGCHTAESLSVNLAYLPVGVRHHDGRCGWRTKMTREQVVVGEADRRDGQLRHQPAVDVVIARQDEVHDVTADVSLCSDVL